MEKVRRSACSKVLIVAMGIFLMAATPMARTQQSSVENTLLTKAQSLAASGHLDMAVQTWQQVLLVNRNNREALLGIAKADMQLGKRDEANQYLDRLQAAGGNPAEIAKIRSMPNVQPREERIRQAGQLAQQGNYAAAMRIYRDIFGENPPAGNYALAYYDTEAAIPADRPHAIAGLRKLSQQFPADSRYAITLGRVLTYDARTRAEGMAILRRYSEVPAAQSALNQAEAWNTAKPAAAVPGETAAPQVAVAPRRFNSPEATAYRALNSGRLDEAKRLFQAILDKQPNSATALSGMGYVAMKQQDFSTAADYLERARAAGARGLDSTLNTAHFWLRMSEGGDKLKAGDADAAAAAYRAALQLKPTSPEALEGLGGALAQAGKYDEAQDAFERAVHVGPQRLTAWRGLFLAQSSGGNAQAALDVDSRMPKNVRSQLMRDPDYLQALAQDNLALGRKEDADRVIAQALALPFPNGGRDLPVAKQLQYASLLMTARKYEPAMRLYQQVVNQDPENVDAWRALVAAQHQLKEDDQALATLGRAPQAVFDQSQNNASFLVLIGSIYQSRHEMDRAQRYLERALSLSPASENIALQLADVYAAQGNVAKAYPIYRRELDENPNNQQAWRGLLNALHVGNRDREALRQIATMPDSMRLRLEEDPAYLQTLASIQSSTGQSQAALKTFGRISRLYADQNVDEPLDVQIQYGWALLKARDDQKLYALVSGLSSVPDMTDDQQANFNSLWAAWSIQRANSALVTNPQRAMAILQTAAQAFPQNADVYNALAGAYMKTGQPRQAVALYASIDMDHATALQYQGAIGAALAANDMSHAQEWLETALDRFKNNAPILKMAAQYEQAHGDNQRAAAYYRAALDAMGPAPLGGGLPQPGSPSALPGSSPTQQLLQLLSPGTRVSRLNDADSDSDRHIDVSWQNAPTNDVPTLGDYAQTGPDSADAPVSPSQSRATLADYLRPNQQDDSTQAADDPVAMPPVRRRMAAQYEDPLPDPVAAREDSEYRPSRTSNRASIPVENDTPDSSMEYLRPASARITPLPPVETQRQMRNANSLRGDSFPAIAESNPANRLQAAVLQMNGQTQTLSPNSTGAPPVVPAETQEAPIEESPARTSSVLESSATPVLPPLSGSMVRRAVQPKTEREQIEEQLAILQGASSGWLGGSFTVDYRSGHPGYDKLAAYTTQTEASGTLGPNVRTTVVVQPVLLDSGVPGIDSTYQQGTLPATTAPYLQSAAGIGGEFQLRAPSFGARIGYTPHGFLVENVTGGLYIHPQTSHFTFTFGRDPVTDTQLSYAGLRDLGSKSLTYVGNVWGGVMTNAGEAQLAFGDAKAGWYIQGGGQYITGLHVQDNYRVDGDAGAYWAVYHNALYGNLTLGLNFFGMHYDHNLRYFTYGQGGYFSPAAYMLAGVPFTWNGHYGPKFHYRIVGSLGAQAFDEDSTPYYPIDLATEAANNYPYYSEMTSVGGNYTLDAEGAYAIAEHWYAGGYLDFNNSRDYAASRVGFFVRYVFRPQPTLEEVGPTGIFPIQGLRPLQVP